MKSERGVTLSSLIIYVIAMSIIVATVATITNYFYGNINGLTNRTNASKEYTMFNSYLTKEINTRGNSVIVNEDHLIVFSTRNQISFINNSIYYNKIKIVKEVTNCKFTISENGKKIKVELTIDGKLFENEYTIQSDI